jgi:murein DD-endopeptidase MepM/ murein hydrolase activator NlpD
MQMTSSQSPSRKIALLTAALSMLAIGLVPTRVDAQSTKDRVNAQRERVSALKSRAGQIAAAYAETEHELEETRDDIVQTQARKRRAETEMGELRNRLKNSVRAAYRNRGIGFFQVLLEARSFRDFSLKLMGLQRQTLADEDTILQLRKKQHELDLIKRELDSREGTLSSQKENYLSQGRRLAITLTEQNRIYRSLQGELRREELARLFRTISGSVRGQSVPLDACPVGGPHNVTNSFGASRGGGSRRHQGNDIMAPHGAPIIAVVSGRVTRTGNGGLGGKSVYLYGNGVEFYYAHLSSISVGAGQSVSAGQRLGGNGDTGNARGGAPHLHFEIHPGGGRAIDPYPSLARVC